MLNLLWKARLAKAKLRRKSHSLSSCSPFIKGWWQFCCITTRCIFQDIKPIKIHTLPTYIYYCNCKANISRYLRELWRSLTELWHYNVNRRHTLPSCYFFLEFREIWHIYRAFYFLDSSSKSFTVFPTVNEVIHIFYFNGSLYDRRLLQSLFVSQFYYNYSPRN